MIRIVLTLTLLLIIDGAASAQPMQAIDTDSSWEISARKRSHARRAQGLSFGSFFSIFQPQARSRRATRRAWRYAPSASYFAAPRTPRYTRSSRASRRVQYHASCGGRAVRATWYKSGTRTASGQRFNPHGLTAAHRTLPFGSRVRVTNPQTGASVNVTINDRGPFVPGILLDLSLGAARAIGMRGTQTVCMS